MRLGPRAVRGAVAGEEVEQDLAARRDAPGVAEAVAQGAEDVDAEPPLLVFVRKRRLERFEAAAHDFAA